MSFSLSRSLSHHLLELSEVDRGICRLTVEVGAVGHVVSHPGVVAGALHLGVEDHPEEEVELAGGDEELQVEGVLGADCLVLDEDQRSGGWTRS